MNIRRWSFMTIEEVVKYLAELPQDTLVTTTLAKQDSTFTVFVDSYGNASIIRDAARCTRRFTIELPDLN